MARAVPVQVSVQQGFGPLDQLVLELFQVLQDGTVQRELGAFTVAAGVAEVPDEPLPDPALRWAVRITDAALSVPVYRSGPLGGLPGRGRVRPLDTRIRLHRGGGHLGLDAPDGAPQALIDHVRDHLPRHVSMRGLDMEADAAGRYALTFEGRYVPLPGASVAFAWRRAFGIAPGLDPGRPRRLAVAWPQGAPGGAVPSFLRPVVRALDDVLRAGVEAQMTAMGFHIGHLMLFAAGVTDLTPQTVSLTSIRLAQEGQEVGASIALTAGAVTGGVRAFEPAAPLAGDLSPSRPPGPGGRTPATPR
jgi:hypothetical protein